MCFIELLVVGAVVRIIRNRGGTHNRAPPAKDAAHGGIGKTPLDSHIMLEQEQAARTHTPLEGTMKIHERVPITAITQRPLTTSRMRRQLKRLVSARPRSRFEVREVTGGSSGRVVGYYIHEYRDVRFKAHTVYGLAEDGAESVEYEIIYGEPQGFQPKRHSA
jgi:hypothetical protein